MARGLSQKAVAEALETTDVTVSNHERGVTRPSDEQLDAYAEFYGVDTQTLRYGGEPALNGPPRSTASLWPAVREYLAELRLRLTKANVPEEEIEEAMDLLRSPQLFRYFKDGELVAYSESDALDGVK